MSEEGGGLIKSLSRLTGEGGDKLIKDFEIEDLGQSSQVQKLVSKAKNTLDNTKQVAGDTAQKLEHLNTFIDSVKTGRELIEGKDPTAPPEIKQAPEIPDPSESDLIQKSNFSVSNNNTSVIQPQQNILINNGVPSPMSQTYNNGLPY